jgi:hypothetical protein
MAGGRHEGRVLNVIYSSKYCRFAAFILPDTFDALLSLGVRVRVDE